jgi:Cu+-exporting ATPase
MNGMITPNSTSRKPETVIDPVCGMSVDPNAAAGSIDYQGHTYFFCRPHCLHKFGEDPERFLTRAVPTQDQPRELVGVTRLTPAPDHVAKSNPVGLPGPGSLQAGGHSKYTCPMHPEVQTDNPSSCPNCGMALEPVTFAPSQTKTEYTCPMHPEIVRAAPGSCPICGMALEPRTVSLADEENPELVDMTRRFWLSASLSLPVFLIGMSDLIPGAPLQRIVPMSVWAWIQLGLSTPVVLWGGWPFFVRGWQSIVNRSLNMFTLIGLGVAVAYVYSLIATIFPQIFPHSFRTHDGVVPVYFEAAAVVTTLVLLGQVLELRARSQTGTAIKSL